MTPIDWYIVLVSVLGALAVDGVLRQAFDENDADPAPTLSHTQHEFFE